MIEVSQIDASWSDLREREGAARMTSLAELAFEMEFEEGAAAEPGAAPLMHSAWTESDALQARHSMLRPDLQP